MSTFYGKYSGILGGGGGGGTTGDLTDAGTDGIVITNGAGAVNGTGTQIAQHVADATHNGYLSSVDWNAFNTAASGGVTTMGAFGSTPNNNGGSIATNTLTLQPADGTHPGGISTTTQTLAGAKTLSSFLTITGGSGANPSISFPTGGGNAGFWWDPAAGAEFVYNTSAVANFTASVWRNTVPFQLFVNTAASAPGIWFINDSSTGIYRSGSNQIGISALNAQVVNFSSSGVDVTGLLTTSNGLTVTGTTTLDTSLNGTLVATAGVVSAVPTTSGTVTSVSVISANGLAGTVATATSTPAITLSTTVTGVLKGNGTAISAASAGTDYQAPISTSAAVSNQFLTAFTAPNTFTHAQPAFTNLSGVATNAQLPTYTNHGVLLGTGSAGIADTGAPTTAGFVLTSNGSGADPTFQAAAAASPLTTKGDLYGFSTVNARIPIGTDTFVLTADSSQALGLKWAAAGGGITALTGDVTASGSGSVAATIAANAVTNAKAAQMATLTIKGNNTGGTANALDLTVAQVNTMLGDVTTLAAVGSSPSANGASISGNTLTLQPADATHPGLVTTAAQTFAGAKTFSSAITGTQVSTPSSPAASNNSIYFKSDNNLYVLNSSGTETQVTGTGFINTSDWTLDSASITPNAGFGTVSGKVAYRKQIGDTIYWRGYWTNGTVSGTSASIAVNAAYTIDTTKMGSSANGTQLGIMWNQAAGSNVAYGANSNVGAVFYDGSSATTVFPTTQSTSSAFAKLSGTTFLNSNQPFNFEFSYPVSGWSSTGNNVATARYFASATTISSSLATISWTTKDYDSNSAMSAGTYTVPVSGKFQINSALLITGTIALNNTVIMEIQKNGTVVSRTTEYIPGTLTDAKVTISDIINCAVSDTLRIQVSTTVTGPSIVSSNFDNYISLALVQ